MIISSRLLSCWPVCWYHSVGITIPRHSAVFYRDTHSIRHSLKSDDTWYWAMYPVEVWWNHDRWKCCWWSILFVFRVLEGWWRYRYRIDFVAWRRYYRRSVSITWPPLLLTLLRHSFWCRDILSHCYYRHGGYCSILFSAHLFYSDDPVAESSSHLLELLLIW